MDKHTHKKGMRKLVRSNKLSKSERIAVFKWACKNDYLVVKER